MNNCIDVRFQYKIKCISFGHIAQFDWVLYQIYWSLNELEILVEIECVMLHEIRPFERHWKWNGNNNENGEETDRKI